MSTSYPVLISCLYRYATILIVIQIQPKEFRCEKDQFGSARCDVSIIFFL